MWHICFALHTVLYSKLNCLSSPITWWHSMLTASIKRLTFNPGPILQAAVRYSSYSEAGLNLLSHNDLLLIYNPTWWLTAWHTVMLGHSFLWCQFWHVPDVLLKSNEATLNSATLPVEPGDQAALVQNRREIVIHTLLICRCSGFVALAGIWTAIFQFGCLKERKQ